MKKHLSEEEKEILDDFEKNDWIPVEDLSARQKELKNYAQNTLKKIRNYRYTIPMF
jgi:hypothetical protein